MQNVLWAKVRFNKQRTRYLLSGAARRGPPTLFFIIYSLFFFLFAPLTLKFLITNF